eukprot:m.150380 g.150380  ORF g.150380 m.150380 type:complete len:557 (-) comp30724_c1_seq6:62-1732(-)
MDGPASKRQKPNEGDDVVNTNATPSHPNMENSMDHTDDELAPPPPVDDTLPDTMSNGSSKNSPLPSGVAAIQKGASWVWKHVKVLVPEGDHEIVKRGTHVCVHPVPEGDCNTPLKLYSTGNRGAFVSTRATEHMKKYHAATYEAATAGKAQTTPARPSWRRSTALKNSVFEIDLKPGASFFGRSASAFGDSPLCRTADGAGELSAECFTYSTGVEAVRVRNALGNIIVLPFQGQQIWDAEFLGRRLTMKSMFAVPRKVDNDKQWGYLDTYGAFFVHCGAEAMGCPSADDEHKLHGDLPNAQYQKAYIRLGVDNRGKFIEVGGEYSHVVAFKTHYVARPSIRLYAGQTTIPITMQLKNEFHKPMDLMYMAHTNFRPVTGSELLCSHFMHADSVTVSSSVNGLVPPTPDYIEFVASVKKDPTIVSRLTPEVIKGLDPEVLLYLRNFLKDADGFAHSMQVLPDGSADYVKHSPDELPRVTRWMVVDGSHSALGLCLPGTAEPTGKASETKKGNLRQLASGNTQIFSIEVGALDKTRANEVHQIIDGILDVPSPGPVPPT